VKIGLIKERKTPPDSRVVLPPQQCKDLLEAFPALEISVESADNRAFSDAEYRALGIPVVDDVSDCDVLLGVKEVPLDSLLPGKKYFFFSHTIKKQPYNRALLQAILEKNIELYDHETLTDVREKRLVAFGRYAGIVGAYNAFRAYGLKYQSFQLPKATSLPTQQSLIEALSAITLPPIKVVLTGKGRVSNGAKEMLDGMQLREVSVHDFLHQTYQEPVYVQLDVLDYNKRTDGTVLDAQDFFTRPQDYHSDFMRFAKEASIYIAGHFYAEGAPYIFSREAARHPDCKIRVVGDISCDIDGPVACTLRASTIEDPVYGYDPISETETDYRQEHAIAVMAVDNLPCELPREASRGFGESFAKHVIPSFFNQDKAGILQRARMTQQGALTERFGYLQDYVAGR